MQNEVHMGLVEVFFSTRVVNRWNMLEQQIVGATSLNAFKKWPRWASSWIVPLSPRPLWLVCVAGEAIQGELQRELPVNGFNRSQLTIILLSASSAVIVNCDVCWARKSWDGRRQRTGRRRWIKRVAAVRRMFLLTTVVALRVVWFTELKRCCCILLILWRLHKTVNRPSKKTQLQKGSNYSVKH